MARSASTTVGQGLRRRLHLVQVRQPGDLVHRLQRGRRRRAPDRAQRDGDVREPGHPVQPGGRQPRRHPGRGPRHRTSAPFLADKTKVGTVYVFAAAGGDGSKTNIAGGINYVEIYNMAAAGISLGAQVNQRGLADDADQDVVLDAVSTVKVAAIAGLESALSLPKVPTGAADNAGGGYFNGAFVETYARAYIDDLALVSAARDITMHALTDTAVLAAARSGAGAATRRRSKGSSASSSSGPSPWRSSRTGRRSTPGGTSWPRPRTRSSSRTWPVSRRPARRRSASRSRSRSSSGPPPSRTGACTTTWASSTTGACSTTTTTRSPAAASGRSSRTPPARWPPSAPAAWWARSRPVATSGCPPRTTRPRTSCGPSRRGAPPPPRTRPTRRAPPVPSRSRSSTRGPTR